MRGLLAALALLLASASNAAPVESDFPWQQWRAEILEQTARAAELFRAALKYPGVYKRVEWWDKREGPLAHDNVEYPELKSAAAFACSGSVCSQPVFEASQVAAAISRLKP